MCLVVCSVIYVVCSLLCSVQSYLVEKAAQTMEVLMKLSMAVAYCGSFMAIRREPSLGEGRFGDSADHWEVSQYRQ